MKRMGKWMERKIEKRMTKKGIDRQTRIMMNLMAMIIGINIYGNLIGIIRALNSLK